MKKFCALPPHPAEPAHSARHGAIPAIVTGISIIYARDIYTLVDQGARILSLENKNVRTNLVFAYTHIRRFTPLQSVQLRAQERIDGMRQSEWNSLNARNEIRHTFSDTYFIHIIDLGGACVTVGRDGGNYFQPSVLCGGETPLWVENFLRSNCHGRTGGTIQYMLERKTRDWLVVMRANFCQMLAGRKVNV